MFGLLVFGAACTYTHANELNRQVVGDTPLMQSIRQATDEDLAWTLCHMDGLRSKEAPPKHVPFNLNSVASPMQVRLPI